jgi:Tol biopolymer transport system component
MNRYKSNFLSLKGLASISLGLFFAGVISLCLFDVTVKTETAEKTTERNAVLGVLAYATQTGSFGIPTASVRTANSDGTGLTVLTNFPPAGSPSWSPDGTKIVYQGETEIYVINSDGSNQTNLTNTPSIFESSPSWSVTGKIVYYRNDQIWIMNADGTNQTQFAGITQTTSSFPVWSRDGGKIAFSSGDGEIWRINADGTNEQRVTTNATNDTTPDWSPDGTKIIFSRLGIGISVVNADGTNETALTNIAGDAYPSWSPDGTTIAFARSGTSGGIFLMDVTGGNQVKIIANTAGSAGDTNSDPTWQPIAQTPNTFTISGRITRNNVSLGGVTLNLSGTTNAVTTTDAAGNYQFSGLQPGGNYTVSPSFLNHYFTPPNRVINNLNSNQITDFTAMGVCISLNCANNGKIAFVRGSEIFTMNSDATNQTNITNNAAIDHSPNYSPDGSKIVFSTNRDGNYEIYRMNEDGTSPVRLTNNPASETSPTYSPDVNSIVFVSNRDGNEELYKMNADGTNQVRLTNNTTQERVPKFSPDGQKIVFVTAPASGSNFTNQLWVMNADGTNQQQFQNPSGPSHYYNHPSYSPNGQKIIFEYGSDASSAGAWTMNADGTNRVRLPFSRSPRYSPDGTKVCSASPIFGNYGIYTHNANGTNSQRLTTDSGDALPDWQPILTLRRTTFDFDGDGRSDISVFRPSEGIWYLLRSTSGFSGLQWGFSTDVLVPGDYDGDLKTDVAVWRPTDSKFYVLNSFNNTVLVDDFGIAGDIPTGGDWDGDGKADVAVYRGGAEGTFYYRGSMGNPQRNISNIPWGTSGDKPVASDYDGDGKTDAAIYRNGTWFIRRSTDGQLSANTFGLPDDVIVPADYDADGKTDLAVYRGGVWYLLRSTQGFAAFQFGISTDIPAPADYDGDGKTDAAIYRNGVWWILKTQSGAAEAVSFGLINDKPISSTFVR